MRRETVAGTANDPIIKFAVLKIYDREYKLAYDFNAIAEAEKVSGCNLLQGLAATMFNSMTAAQLRGLLFAAMRIAHPNKKINGKTTPLSIDDAGRLIRIDTMPDVRNALVEAYNLSLAEEDKKDADPTSAVEDGGASL